jgi:hypothetical protein
MIHIVVFEEKVRDQELEELRHLLRGNAGGFAAMPVA